MDDTLLKSYYKGADPAYFCGVNELAAARDQFGSIKTFFGGIKNPIGIEVEAEGINNVTLRKLGPLLELYWRTTGDGSLRNEGVEFISKPVQGHNIDYALHGMLQFLEAAKPEWSHRCSIHVHVNVGSYRQSHLKALVLMYALFEELFWVLPQNRKENSFCYPLTNLAPEDVFVHEDMKYCAFNLAPISRQLTVEFRHLHGTQNPLVFKRWVQLIVKLHRYVEQNSQEIIRNYCNWGVSDYRNLIEKVFGINSQLFSDFDVKELIVGHTWGRVFYDCNENKVFSFNHQI